MGTHKLGLARVQSVKVGASCRQRTTLPSAVFQKDALAKRQFWTRVEMLLVVGSGEGKRKANSGGYACQRRRPDWLIPKRPYQGPLRVVAR